MVKISKGKKLFAFGIICLTALLTTCKNSVGLGSSIDINPPTVDAKTIYPPVGAVIKESFILSVEAKDDTEVVSIAVTITPDTESANPGQAISNTAQGFFYLKKTENGVRWEAEVNKINEAQGYPIKDGTYKAEFLVKDRFDKEVRTVSTFTVDNTPPLLILNRPSTTTADSSTDVFGADFLLVGQVYDETSVSALKIAAEGNGQKHEKTLNNIPQNIRITVDSFGSTTDDPFYKSLYPWDQNSEQKNYEYTIAVTDSAKEYKKPGDSGAGTGNSTDRYYLFDDLYKPVLSTYKIQEVYAMLRGTYNTESGWLRSAAGTEPGQEVKKALLDYQLGGAGEGSKKGTFGLNPSLNPRFAIVGEEPTQRPSSPSGVPNFSPLYSDSSLNVKISSNLDGVPLEGDSTYRFFLMKWSDFLDYTGTLPYPADKLNGSGTDSIYADEESQTLKSDGFAAKLLKILNPSFKKEGSNYIFTLSISSTTVPGISYGQSYVLLVRGKDQNGNSLMPDLGGVSGGAYGFRFVTTGKVPEVYVTKIKGSVSGHETVGTGTAPRLNITERAYLKKDDAMEFTVHIEAASASSLWYKLEGTTGGDVEVTIPNPPADQTITIPSSKFDPNTEKTYKLTVKATADTGSSLEQTYTIVYDVKEPEAEITTLVADSVISGTGTDEFVVSGTAFDASSGLKEVKATLSKDDGANTFTDTPLTVTTTEGRWSTKVGKFSDGNYGEGKYTLKVTAEDKLGWKKTLSRSFFYDKKAPAITDLKVDGKTVVNGGTVYTNTTSTSVAVSGNLEETYGTETFTINGSADGLPSQTNVFNKSLTLTEGRHNIAIVLKDKAGQSAPEFKFDVVVDRTAPEFENIKFAGRDPSSTMIETSDNPIKITGKFKDPLSGIKEVKYAVTASTASAPINDSDWKQLNGTPNGNDYDLDGFIEKQSGNVEKRIHIRAFDNAGNYPQPDIIQNIKVVPPAVIAWKLEPMSSSSPQGVVYKNAGTWYAAGQFKVKIGGTLNSAPSSGAAMTVAIERAGTPPSTVTPGSFFDSWTGYEPKIFPTDVPQPYTVKSTVIEGEYTITLSAEGQEQSLAIVIDKTKPLVTRLEPATNAITELKPVFKASISDSAGIKAGTAMVHYKKEGDTVFTDQLLTKSSDGSYTFTPTANMVEGKYELYFSAEDNVGNKTTTLTQTITIDKEPPELKEVKVNTKDSNTVYIKNGDGNVTITGKAKDTNGIKVDILENGTPINHTPITIESNGTWTRSFTSAELADGTHNLTIRATDNAGKIAEVQKTVVVDRGVPTLSVTKLGTTAISGNNFITFSSGYVAEGDLLIEGTATDSAAGASGIDFVRYIFNDGTNNIGAVRGFDLDSSGAFSQTIQVPAAAKKLTLTCADRLGNKHEISIPLKVDSKMPLRPTITDVGGKGNVPAITVSGKEAGGITIRGTVSDDKTGGAGSFSGIKEIHWTLNDKNDSGTLNTGVTPNEWVLTIPKDKIQAGSVIITATDNVDYTSPSATVVFLQDTEAPIAKITNFDEHTAKTGDIMVKGSVSDRGTAGVLPNKTQWKIVKIAEGIPTVENPGGNWTNVDNSTVGTWEITSLNLGRYFAESGGSYTSEYAIPHGTPSDGLFDLPLYLWVEDASENKAIIKLNILVDPAGDKPVVTLIAPLSPVNSTTPLSVGGQVTVYGSATVAEGSVGKVFMDVSEDPNFTSFVSGWQNKEIEGTVNWNTVLNQSNEINALITGSNRTKIIYYRVRAQNGNPPHKMGGYSAVQKLLFDKGAPVIQGAKLHKYDALLPSPHYVAKDYKEKQWISGDNDYLTFSITDDSGIKNIKVITTINGNGTTKELKTKAEIENYQIDGKNIFTATTAHGSYSDYTAKFPLKTSSLAEVGGEYSITVTVTEGTATGSTFLTQTATYIFNFDKEAPSGYIGEQVEVGNSTFTGTTLPSLLNIAKVGQYLYVNKQKVSIVADTSPGTKKLGQAVSGKFDWVLYKDRDYFTASAAVMDDPDVTKTSAVIRGVAYDEGTAGVAKITGYIKKGSTKITDTDFTVEKNAFRKPIGDFITWEATVSIPKAGVDDGQYTLVYTVEDGNGNKSTELTQVINIKRKGIRISKVLLGTDLNRSNSIETGTDEVVAFAETKGKKADGTETPQQDDRTFDWSGDIDASSFVFKKTTSSVPGSIIGSIGVEYTGGNGSISYTLKKGSTTIKSGSLPADKTIPLRQAEFATIGNGEVELDLELSDSRGWKAFEKIKTKVDTTDGIKPKGGVLPLFWNDTGAKQNDVAKNSIAWNGATAEGHISYEGYNTTPAAASPTWSDKPAVSGKIVVSGYVYDETLLKQITVTAASATVTSTFQNDAGNTWNNGTAPGLSLEVKTQKLNQSGHYAFWELTWDTATISNGVGSNITVSVTATDTSHSQDSTNKIKIIKGSDETGTSTASTTPPPPKLRGGSGTDLTIKALPNADADMIKVGQTVRLYSSDESVDAYYVYIKTKEEIEIDKTNKKLLLGLSESVDKTVTKYQIYTNTADTTAKDNQSTTVDVVPFITSIENEAGQGLSNSVIRGSDGVYSMNYSTTEKMTVKGFNLQPASGTTTAKIGSSTVAVSNVTANSIKVSKNVGSGELVLTVGTVESINNKVDVNKPYNQEGKITDPSSNLWNAKRELVFWENKQVCTSNTDQTFYYPSMVMNDAQPIFAYCNNNEGYTYRTTGDNATAKRGGRWYARNAVLAKTSDSPAKYMILSNEDNFDSNQFSGYLYLNSSDIEGGARIGQNYSSPASFIELCSASYGNSSWQKPSLNRFKYPNLIVNGNQTNAQIYISYYDSKEKEIRFFAFKKTGKDTSNIGTEADSASSSPRGLAKGTLAVPGTSGAKSSEHTAMAKVDNGIYIAYQDASSTTLKLAYSKAPLDGSGLANTAAVWNTLEVDSGVLTGAYVSMVASGTKLYIAYHDAAKSALKLAVVDTTKNVLDADSITSKVIVDAYQSVGYKTGITMVNNLPYISYYNNAQAGTKSTIKVAYPKDAAAIGLAGAEESGAFTGKWFARYIPSISTPNVSIPEFNRVMINNYQVGTTDKPVLAWLGDPFIEYTKMR